MDDSRLLFPEKPTRQLLFFLSGGVINGFVLSYQLTEANAVAWHYVTGGFLLVVGVFLSQGNYPNIYAYSSFCRRLLSMWSQLGRYKRSILKTLVIVAVTAVPGVVLLRRYPVTNVRFYSYYLGSTISITILPIGILIRRLIIQRQSPAV